MSSGSDYESASSSDFDEDFEISDSLKKQNHPLQYENLELKTILSNALNRLQIAKIPVNEDNFKLFNPNSTVSFNFFKENCIKTVENLETECLKTETQSYSNYNCLLCCFALREYAFLPCFHLISCEECFEKCKEFPICRKLKCRTIN